MTREKAIEVIKSECYVFNPLNLDRTTLINTALDVAIEMLEKKVSEPWCEGCKEHDKEHHCCHRYSNVIRQTLDDNINAVLEDIKEEFQELVDYYVEVQDGFAELAVKKCIELIDRHMGGGEKNDTNRG